MRRPISWDPPGKHYNLKCSRKPSGTPVDTPVEAMPPGYEWRMSMKDWLGKHVRYSKMMRFVLWDEDRRLFNVERWCFRGSVDDWIFLKGPAPLPALIDMYAQHLGQESFYDLM